MSTPIGAVGTSKRRSGFWRGGVNPIDASAMAGERRAIVATRAAELHSDMPLPGMRQAGQIKRIWDTPRLRKKGHEGRFPGLAGGRPRLRSRAPS